MGKTLMALAAGLTQVLDDRRYTEIIMTRATVSVGEDIISCPAPRKKRWARGWVRWTTTSNSSPRATAAMPVNGARRHQRTDPQPHQDQEHELHARRAFMNKYVIIDEAQTSRPKQMKTLITRAGPGTKIICMGNLAQIDTPYLTEGSSGLTFAVDRFQGWHAQRPHHPWPAANARDWRISPARL